MPACFVMLFWGSSGLITNIFKNLLSNSNLNSTVLVNPAPLYISAHLCPIFGILSNLWRLQKQRRIGNARKNLVGIAVMHYSLPKSNGMFFTLHTESVIQISDWLAVLAFEFEELKAEYSVCEGFSWKVVRSEF